MFSRRLTVLVLAVAALAAAAPSPAAAAPTDLLFVQETSGGELIRTGPDRYKLRLHDVSAGVTSFTDRPTRNAGRESVRTFVSRWSARGFADDPPNAALVVNDAPESSDVTLLTLSRPKYDKRSRTLTYAARPLKGEPAGSLADFGRRDDRVRARSFRAASLFIDNAGSATAYQQLTLAVNGINPGQSVGVQVKPVSPSSHIGFSSGPPFSDSSGVTFVSSTGYVPVASFELQPGLVTFTTAAAGAGGPSQTVVLQVFLAADANVEDFYLRSLSDPGVTVTAALSGRQAQFVPPTDALFAWDAE